MTRRIVSFAQAEPCLLCMSCYRSKEHRRTAMVAVGLLGMVGLLQYGAIKDVVCHPSSTQPVRRGSVGKVACELRACTLLACSWPCFRLPLLGGTAAINKQSILCSPRVTNIAVTTLSIHRPSDTALGPFTLWRRPRQVKTAVVPDRRPPSTLSCRWTAGKISIPACAMMHTRSPTGISRLCRRRRPLVSCCTLPCRRSRARRMQVAGC
jgi:hypothetical protein